MLLLLSACGPGYTPESITEDPVVPVVDTAGDDDEPSPYVYDENPEEETPLLTASDLETGVLQALEVVFTLDPRPLHQAYDRVLLEADSECPYVYDSYLELYGYYYWYDTCTTSEGARFTGNGRHYSYGPDESDSGYYDYDYINYYYGSAKVIDTEGNTFTGAGYSYNYEFTYTYNDYRYFYASMYGEFHWDGPEAQGTWLEDDLSVVNVLYTNRAPDGGTYTALDTSISGVSGVVNAAVFDGLVIYDELRASPCPLEPSGTISLRDATGDWYDVDFHGPDSGATAMFPPDCDGCGPAYWKGEYIGDVCPDFGPLLDWGVTPWD